jgi:hypothetical protein
MKMRILWTSVAVFTAIVMGSEAEAQKRSGLVKFEGCLYYRTNPPPPCFIVGDYALVGVKPGTATTTWSGVYVTGEGRPAGNIGLCGRKPLRVVSITAHRLCFLPLR